MAEITTKEAAERANLSPWRIVQLVNAGTVKARRFGHAWMIDEESLVEYIQSPRKPGPRKGQPATWRKKGQPKAKKERRAVA